MDASPEALYPENKWNLLRKTADLVAKHPGYLAEKDQTKTLTPPSLQSIDSDLYT